MQPAQPRGSDPWPNSTSHTASRLNSSVYCARVELVVFVSLVHPQSFS